jgi:hypothetical protein
MRSLSTRTTGLLILALGLWGGLVPFVGHYFHFALGPDKSWAWTAGRLYLSVLPAAAAVLGGLLLIGAGPHPSARLGALLAIAAGIWFAIGPDVSHLWNAAGAQGAAHGSKTIRVLEMLAYHTGLGGLLAALGGYALPRFVAPRDVVAEPAVAREPGRVTDRPLARDAALSGGAVAAERERATTEVPAEERTEQLGAAPATTDSREARAADASAPVADRDAEDAQAPTAEPDAEYAHAPTAEPGAGAPIAARGSVPTADDGIDGAADGSDEQASAEPAHAPATTPAADHTGQYGGAAPAAGDADGYTNPTRTVRRRRGGLLSGLLSRR